ncbi:ATP-binding protein [Streptomyces sp. NPDC127119]|uniref:sensor histidine kinase n=1 Tax=Streptomyces sp. NPDC127119 TaxID=3345370 RepID=UPI0036268C6A
MTSPTHPGERPATRGLLTAFVLTAVLSGLAVAGAVVIAPPGVRLPLALGGSAAGLLLCVAVVVAVYAVLSGRTMRRRLETLTQDVGRMLQERVRLTEDTRLERVRLTGELERERARLTAELAQEHARLTDSLAAERARIVQEQGAEHARLADSLTAERDHLAREHSTKSARLAEENAQLTALLREANASRTAAVSATANAAGRMQAVATAMLADLRAMEERHADEDVLADLLHLDHRTAQAGRLADSLAVLTGARSGRRWARPIGMESILRGAMGRIGSYQRVRVHSASQAAVAGHAAEAVMHALAELLDNAANFSPPTAEVHVYVEEVPAGVIVSVEDSGLVMSDLQLRRAEEAVTGRGSELGGLTGTRLGLAVVGRLAHRYGLKISFRPSARGGTGVLLLVPQDILVVQGTSIPSADRTPEVPAAGKPSATAGTTTAPAVPELPRRHGGSVAPVPEKGADAARALAPGRHLVSAPAPAPAHAFATSGTPGTPAPSGTPGPATGEEESVEDLPRRRRGRTLAEAEAERARVAAHSATPHTAPAAVDVQVRAARFGSFRQAVRGVPAAAEQRATAGADTAGTAGTADQPSGTGTGTAPAPAPAPGAEPGAGTAPAGASASPTAPDTGQSPPAPMSG